METYIVGRKHTVESIILQPGAVVGTGKVADGVFEPAEGLEHALSLGRVIPRLDDGRIVVAETKNEPPAKPAKAGKQTKKDEQP